MTKKKNPSIKNGRETRSLTVIGGKGRENGPTEM